MYRNATYTGITPEFWNSCERIAGPEAVGVVGSAQLRQRRADADWPGRTRRRPGPLPQCSCWSNVMLGESAIKKVTDRVLGLSRADQTEVMFFGDASQLTRFANNYIHQNVAETNTQVSVRVVHG